MALFSAKKKTEKKKAPPKSTTGKLRAIRAHEVLESPIISEKTVQIAQQSVYTFRVSSDATKKTIKEAIEDVYKVTPVKVHVVATARKPKRSRFSRKVNKVGGGKKAYVYLPKGKHIQLT